MLHRIPVPESDGIFLPSERAFFCAFKGFEIDGDSEGGADLVLATVAASNGPRLIIKHGEVLPELLGDGTGFFDQFGLIFEQRENARFHWGHPGMEAKNYTGFFGALFVGDFFFIVRFAKEGEGCSIDPGAGFHHVGNKLLPGLFIEIFQGFSAGLLMLFEIVVGAVSDPLQLFGAERKGVKQVVGPLGVEGAIFFRNIKDGDLAAWDPNRFVPGQPIGEPLVEPLFALFWANEEFNLHLFEFTGTEGKVAGIDFVSEGFSDLGDAEGKFLAGNLEDIFKLNKHGLGGFRAEVGEVPFVLDWADIGFEHEIELAGFGELSPASGDKFAGFLGAGGGGDLVGTETAFAGFAIDHGVGESGFVAAGFPNGAAHENGAIHSDDIVPVLGHRFPPIFLQVTFQCHAEGTVVPGAIQPAVDFGRWKDKAPAFAESDNFFHTVIRHRLIFGF